MKGGIQLVGLVAVLVSAGFVVGFSNQDAPAVELADEIQVAQEGETAAEILATIPGEGRIHMTMVTSEGAIECTLFDDLVPNTVANFVGLAEGLKTFVDPETGESTRRRFYDGLIFHRVIPQFMIQGGDPQGTGRGGPGYSFNDEFHPEARHSHGGILSMANSGPNTNGSQFFVIEVPTPHLDDRHSVFGDCAESLEVVVRIGHVPTDASDKPLDPIMIETITFERRP